jgi:hypothetical protein
MKNSFLTDFVAKDRRNKLNWRVSSALLVAIALLFALQGFSRADDDGDHHATAIFDCSLAPFMINNPGLYFLANDLKQCAAGGIFITVSDVQLELRGHTIEGTTIDVSMIKVNGTAGLSNIKIEGPGTVTGGLAGIEFDNVCRSLVHNVAVVGSFDGIDINATDFSCDQATRDTAAIYSEFRDNVVQNVFSNNVVADSISNGIKVNGGNDNLFIHNNLSGNVGDGLLFSNAKNNVVRQNTVDANLGNGINFLNLGSGNTIEIENNTVLGNGRNAGVDILGQNNIFCAKNSFDLTTPVCF